MARSYCKSSPDHVVVAVRCLLMQYTKPCHVIKPPLYIFRIRSIVPGAVDFVLSIYSGPRGERSEPLASCKRPRRISSAISTTSAGDAGKAVVVRRVTHCTSILSSAVESICWYAWAYDCEIPSAMRRWSVVQGMLNASAACRNDVCLPE